MERPPQTAERASDANSLILALRNREKLQGLAWDFEIDAQEGLTRVWWKMKAGEMVSGRRLLAPEAPGGYGNRGFVGASR